MIGGALPVPVTAACVEGLCSALLERLAPASVRRAGTTRPDSVPCARAFLSGLARFLPVAFQLVLAGQEGLID